MTPKTSSTQPLADADDAPDLSAPEWPDRLAKIVPASGPLEGADLERSRDFGRDVLLIDEIAPLRSEEEYGSALREIEQYFREEPSSGTPEAARFDQLFEHIRLYESAHWPVSPPDPDE